MYAPINILDILIWSVIVGVTSFISEQNIYHKKKKTCYFYMKIVLLTDSRFVSTVFKKMIFVHKNSKKKEGIEQRN
jgi:hypothetical protein